MPGIFLSISYWAIPVLLGLVLITAIHKKVKLYEVFIEGAMEGLKTTIKLTPYILAIFVAIGIFRTSGALNFVVYIFKPLLKLLNISPDLLTLGILKPLSGSASLGLTAELLSKYGPDSKLGITASLIQGSSETTFYIISIYLGSVFIKNGRHTLMMGLCGELAAFLLAIVLGGLIGH